MSETEASDRYWTDQADAAYREISEWSSDTGKYANHELRGTGAKRGDRGKRTTFYGWCSCGYGVPSSVNIASVKHKHRAHVERESA